MKKSLLFVCAVIPLLVFVGLRRNSAPFFSVQNYCCVKSVLLSDDHFASINSTLAALIGDNVAAYELIDRLKKQFPVLDKIIISYRPSATHVMLYPYQPVCCINNSLVLTAHNELLPKDVFSADAVADIAKIAVAQDGMVNIPVCVSSLLRELPSDFNQQYNLELVNEHCVHLVDKEESNFVVTLTVAQEKSPMLLTQCALVKKNIGERKGFDKGAKWIADTRFAHYIVAYKT